MSARKAILAGSWYPAGASACRREIERYVQDAAYTPDPQKQYKGGIVPHAGWHFSGSIACNVIDSLKHKSSIDVFAVFGMHLHPRSPNYIMTEGAWETPLGDIEIESRLAVELSKRFPFTVETGDWHTQDNTIEVQLPFIKYFYPEARLVPIGVSPAPSSLDIGRTIVQLSKAFGLSIKVLGSTDLTHYGANYGFSPHGVGEQALNWVVRENDAAVIEAMEAMDPAKVIEEALEHHNACCAGAAASAIEAAKTLGASSAEQVRYATSYEKSPGESFVGYVGIVFY
ncbi:MAG: AmmeMemoRadiSam system protein B [Desulfobacterales bacterium]